MLFKPLGEAGASGWMREALRDGLNTQLSELSNVKVYSKEFIDFLITREGLTEIEAANRLGITKMLSGSFVDVAGTLRIETHVVDVASGVLESSYATVGREEDFPELQNRMVLGIVSRLNLPITADERQALLTRKATDMNALRLLLEAEGGTPRDAPPPKPGGPDSALPRWLAAVSVRARAAQAADGAGENAEVNAEIRAMLERYRRATEARQVRDVAAVYTEFSAEQQAAQQRYFDNVRDLRVGIDNVDVAVVGDEAVVSYTRTDDFADARTGRPMHVAVRLTKLLRRQGGEWRIAGAR
jgi:ketosteroid isomerase-like protein